MLELDDIQSGVLRPRPTPYAATYVLFRIDDRQSGRELMRRIRPVVASAAHRASPTADTWVSVALSFQGLIALGVPQASLDSFSPEFQQGMAARAEILGDTGESSPEHWEKPLGSADVHVVLTALAPDAERLESALARAREEYQKISGITAIWRQNCHALPTEREAFGFKDGISHPAIEGSGIPGTNPHEQPLRPGEFVLGYPDEMGDGPATPKAGCFGT
jgi:deferrochelatase/peroxidase EfeB